MSTPRRPMIETSNATTRLGKRRKPGDWPWSYSRSTPLSSASGIPRRPETLVVTNDVPEPKSRFRNSYWYSVMSRSPGIAISASAPRAYPVEPCPLVDDFLPGLLIVQIEIQSVLVHDRSRVTGIPNRTSSADALERILTEGIETEFRQVG